MPDAESESIEEIANWKEHIESAIREIVLNVLLPLLVALGAATLFVEAGRFFYAKAADASVLEGPTVPVAIGPG